MSKLSEKDRALLAGLNLNPDAPALDYVPERTTTSTPSVDPRTMPVSDIVWDPAVLDEFPSLEGDGQQAAYRMLWNTYKSYGRNPDRNRRLHDEIGLFIQRVRRSRESGTEHVKGTVRAGKKQRDLLALLAEHGIKSVDDLKKTLEGA